MFRLQPVVQCMSGLEATLYVDLISSPANQFLDNVTSLHPNNLLPARDEKIIPFPPSKASEIFHKVLAVAGDASYS